MRLWLSQQVLLWVLDITLTGCIILRFCCCIINFFIKTGFVFEQRVPGWMKLLNIASFAMCSQVNLHYFPRRIIQHDKMMKVSRTTSIHVNKWHRLTKVETLLARIAENDGSITLYEVLQGEHFNFSKKSQHSQGPIMIRKQCIFSLVLSSLFLLDFLWETQLIIVAFRSLFQAKIALFAEEQNRSYKSSYDISNFVVLFVAGFQLLSNKLWASVFICPTRMKNSGPSWIKILRSTVSPTVKKTQVA